MGERWENLGWQAWIKWQVCTRIINFLETVVERRPKDGGLRENESSTLFSFSGVWD